MRLVWNEGYNLGLAIVDEQHRNILDRTNKLTDAAEPPCEPGSVCDALEDLLTYAHYHFLMEEDLFARFRYPGAAKHVALHDQFRQKLREYIETIKKREAEVETVASEAALYASKWLFGHVLNHDKKYRDFLRDHGM